MYFCLIVQCFDLFFDVFRRFSFLSQLDTTVSRPFQGSFLVSFLVCLRVFEKVVLSISAYSFLNPPTWREWRRMREKVEEDAESNTPNERKMRMQERTPGPAHTHILV